MYAKYNIQSSLGLNFFAWLEDQENDEIVERISDEIDRLIWGTEGVSPDWYREIPFIVITMVGKTKEEDWEEVGRLLAESREWHFPTYLCRRLFLAGVQEWLRAMHKDPFLVKEYLDNRYFCDSAWEYNEELVLANKGLLAELFEKYYLNVNIVEEMKEYCDLEMERCNFEYRLSPDQVRNLAACEVQLQIEEMLQVGSLRDSSWAKNCFDHAAVAEMVTDDERLNETVRFLRDNMVFPDHSSSWDVPTQDTVYPRTVY